MIYNALLKLRGTFTSFRTDWQNITHGHHILTTFTLLTGMIYVMQVTFET